MSTTNIRGGNLQRGRRDGVGWLWFRAGLPGGYCYPAGFERALSSAIEAGPTFCDPPQKNHRTNTAGGQPAGAGREDD